MRVIPVIDLRDGMAVHGSGGERAHYELVESAILPERGDAVALAHAYVRVLGNGELYVADLDALRGAAPQYAMHGALARVSRCWIDAGARSTEEACALIDVGANRVVVGLETLPDFAVLRAVVARLGAERVVFSLDLRAGRPVTMVDAMRAMHASAIARRAVDAGCETVIVLDLARVGSAAGVDEALIAELRAALPGVDLIAGGGVRDRADLDRLAAAGANGALVATAVHRGAIG
jgi:phosphoribosylformimino-5-aminoimidazole carboxamide ribotide isomerase